MHMISHNKTYNHSVTSSYIYFVITSQIMKTEKWNY